MVAVPLEQAVVYVYRLTTPPYARKPDIKVNDVLVAELPTNSYFALKLKPGTYTFRTDWGAIDGLILNRSTVLSVSAGKSYYVEFTGKAGVVMSTVTYGAGAVSREASAPPSAIHDCSLVSSTTVNVVAK